MNPAAEAAASPGRPADQLADLLLRAAERRPDRVALSDDQGDLTYRELLDAVRAAARSLGDLGVGPGDRVVSRLGNTRDTVTWLFATCWRGAIHVPINPGMTEYQLRSVVDDCEPVVALTRGEDVAVLGGLGVRTVDIDAPAVPRSAAACDATAPLGGGDDLAMLIYTSGSTAAPKGVAAPHRCVLFATAAIAERLAYRADDVVLVAIPLAFDYGLYQVFLSLSAGARVVLTDPSNTLAVRSAILRHGVTVLPAVPSLAEVVVRMTTRADGAPSTLRMITNTGAALTDGLIRSLRACLPRTRIVPMFGTTECKRISINEPDGDLVRPGSLGRALTGTQILVIDEHGEPLPAGEVGEITVEGPHVMAGYWRSPELTAQRFRPTAEGGVRLHTGDYGWLDSDGYLYFEGRRDDLFKRRGHRMSTTEIEAAATDLPGVHSAAALPPSADHDLTLVAVTDLAPDDVLKGLRLRLERAKIPAECVVLDAMPLTSNGKVDRKALRALLAPPSRPAAAQVA